jgi:cobalt/nickel transport system ATP-binding protein
MSVAIELTDLRYTYPDGTPALNGFSCSVQKGECIAIVGPSGAGKSTIALCMTGLILPQSGTVRIGEVELQKNNLKQLRSRVGLIFQNPDDQLFMPSLFDDVAFGLVQKGMAEQIIRENVARALAEMGLKGLENKFPGHLSGGQKRLASLAGVLAMEPETLILDEPSANLDLKARRTLIHRLAALKNTRIILSHDLEMILDLAGRIILINHGTVIAEGEPHKILGDRGLMTANSLEVPHSLLPHQDPHHRLKS